MFPQAAFLIPLFLFPLQITAQTPVTFNCTDTPNACENFCYVTNCGNLPNSYTKVAPGFDPNVNRKASGVIRTNSRPRPCKDTSLQWTTAAQTEYGTTALDTDEWPPASATQGGFGASLRCMPSGDNRRAGSRLGPVPRGTNFMIVLSETNYPGNIFCNNQCQTWTGGLDHQFQWLGLQNDQYVAPPDPADDGVASKLRRARRSPMIMVEKTEPARFLTSRGDEVTAFVAKGQEIDIREGSVIDEGFDDEAVIVKRLA